MGSTRDSGLTTCWFYVSIRFSPNETVSVLTRRVALVVIGAPLKAQLPPALFYLASYFVVNVNVIHNSRFYLSVG